MSDDLTDYEYLRDALDLDNDYKDKDVLYDLYIERNMTQAEINDLFNLSDSGVQYWINKFDISKDMSAYTTGPPVSEEKLYTMYWDNGMSQSEIGKQLGYEQTAIYKWMNEYNIETRGPGGNPEPPASEERLRELYHDKGMGCRPISEKLNCGRSTVSDWLDRFNIEKHNSGNRIKTGKLVDEVVDMYSDGLTQKEISDEVGVNQTTISDWLLERNIDIRNKAGFGSIKETDAGEKVKSSYEEYVANKLYENNIDYIYEETLDDIKYIPDFVVSGKIVEVWGITNDERYDSRRETKIDTYTEHGYDVFSIFPGTIEQDTLEVIHNV